MEIRKCGCFPPVSCFAACAENVTQVQVTRDSCASSSGQQFLLPLTLGSVYTTIEVGQKKERRERKRESEREREKKRYRTE